ncbi:MAG: cyclic nucleotide-binding domain-containing protein [Myxococcaceae bacterium]
MTGWARRLAPGATFQFFFVAAIALLKPSTNALVIARYQAGSLPWLYLIGAFATGALAGWNAVQPGRRVPPRAMAVFGAAASVAFALALHFGYSTLALPAYVFIEAYATSASLSFWGAMGEAFDSREARRAFTVISAVGMSGAIVGGVLAQALAVRFDAIALLWGGAVLLGLGSVAYTFHRSELPARTPVAPLGRESFGHVLSNAYARSLARVVLSFSILAVLSDFVFRETAGAQLHEQQMASLFASSQTWTGALCVVFQLFAAEPLLRRFGIVRYLMMVPAALGLTALVCALWPSLWAAWTLKLLEGAASLSLMPVGFQLLYGPLADAARDGVRSVIDGFLRKAGLAVAGVLLLLANNRVPAIAFPLLVVGLCGATLWALSRMRGRYVDALHERVAGARGEVELEDALLADALKSPSPEKVLRALELFEHGGVDIRPQLKGLLTHPHERVQERAVQLSLSLKVPAVSKELEALVKGGSRRPRDAAVWALAELNPMKGALLLPPLLEAPDVGLRCAAIGALIRLDRQVGSILNRPAMEETASVRMGREAFFARDGAKVASAALAKLLSSGASAPVIERREVARLLGKLGDETYASALAKYLDDADSSVRQVALKAVGEGKYLSLAPRLLRFLTWRDERRAARQALAALGDEVVPFVTQAMDDRTRALQLRMQLPRVLRHIGTAGALEALLFSNAADDPALHYRVGVAISRLRDEHPAYQVDVKRVMEALERRRQTYRALAPAYADLKAALGVDSLVTRAVGDRLDQALELSFWLLGLIHEPRAMRRAHAHLIGNDARKRAYAQELLEHTLAEDQRAVVALQIDEHHHSLAKGDGTWLEAHLAALCKSDDFVLRAVARQVARERSVWPQGFKEDDMPEVTLKKLFALEGVEIFAQSDVDDLAAIAAVAREKNFKAGELIFQTGDPGDALYVIVEGTVEARRGGELVMTFKQKQAFGDVSLFDGAPRLTDNFAVDEVKTLVIDRRDFLDLLADRPELLTGVFRVISAQLKTMVMDLTRRVTGEVQAVHVA